MRIGIYNPFFDSLSGGERYMLALASHWSQQHTVRVFWDDPSMPIKAADRLSLDLSRVTTTPNFFGKPGLLQKLWQSGQYDLIVFLSDGSIPTSLARHNILHFQVPFPHIAMSLWKRRQFDAVVYNSQFTKNTIDPSIGRDGVVIYPPVDPIAQNKQVKKENTILSVGRFTSYFTSKKQDVLLDAFIQGHRSGQLKDWKLVLAGSLLATDQDYFAKLTAKAPKEFVTFYPNVSHHQLVRLYQQASLYWHAAGFGQSDPQLMEHFGITAVEAMSAGCIPIVYDGGGLPEIVRPGIDGFVWKTVKELQNQTVEVIKNSKRAVDIRRAGERRAGDFGPGQFFDAFDGLLTRMV